MRCESLVRLGGEHRRLDLVDVLLAARPPRPRSRRRPGRRPRRRPPTARGRAPRPAPRGRAGRCAARRPCRAGRVTTKLRPTNRLISPVSTASSSSTYQSVLRTRNSASSYRSSFGRWCAVSASSTASGCSVEDVRDPVELVLRRARAGRPRRSRRRRSPGRGPPARSSWLQSTGDPDAVAVERAVDDHAQLRVRARVALCVTMATVILPGTAAPPRTRPACWPGGARACTSTSAAAQQAEAAAERLAGLPLAAVVTSPLERCRETARAIARRAGHAAGDRRTERAASSATTATGPAASSRSWPRSRCGRTVQAHPSGVDVPRGRVDGRDVGARGRRGPRAGTPRVEAEHGAGRGLGGGQPRRRDQGDPGRRARHAPRRVPADRGRPGAPVGGPLHPAAAVRGDHEHHRRRPRPPASRRRRAKRPARRRDATSSDAGRRTAAPRATA